MRENADANGCQAARWRSWVAFAAALLLPVMLVLSGCETLQVGSDYDRAAPFSAYHTFTWLPRENYGVADPLVVQRTRDAIESALERKGYRYVSELQQADFAVDFTIGSRERVDLRAYPMPYAGPWGWYGPRWWGYPYWGTGVDVYRYREGILGIDVFDGKTHRPVWHGWAKKPLSREDMEHSAEPIREAVDAVLARFPPG